MNPQTPEVHKFRQVMNKLDEKPEVDIEGQPNSSAYTVDI